MQSFFLVEGKMRANAQNWLELADKVHHFRRDQLSSKDLGDLLQKREGLRALMRERADAGKLKLGIEDLEGTMRRTGGKIYPKSTVQEYVEFFLVAAIVVLGVRTYFVQPFKIPTNSMWPSYNGMTPHVYNDPAEIPGALKKLVRFAAFGASYHEVIAPADGKISVPIYPNSGGRIFFEKKPGRKWGVVPTNVREYEFQVGDEVVRFQVPEDFDFDWAFRETFGYTADQLDDLARRSNSTDYRHFRWVVLERNAIRGKPLLAFDIMTGDQLFVDRMSYHFVPPTVGDGFVFRTGNIPGIGQDQYYIKRLVGVPGDKIEIRDPVLYRNGQPITGSEGFRKNNAREDKYRGYRNLGSLSSGSEVDVTADGFLALGDNSSNSADGRYWGLVPRKDVIGRPLFVYYPFTRHWGTAP
ncbi:MAG: signal peptidase I [Verrucomicrobia bacterium]|nr:signal peptidase I [Verrucomicrobiota bacterium]